MISVGKTNVPLAANFTLSPTTGMDEPSVVMTTPATVELNEQTPMDVNVVDPADGIVSDEAVAEYCGPKRAVGLMLIAIMVFYTLFVRLIQE